MIHTVSKKMISGLSVQGLTHFDSHVLEAHWISYRILKLEWGIEKCMKFHLQSRYNSQIANQGGDRLVYLNPYQNIGILREPILINQYNTLYKYLGIWIINKN